MTTIASRLREVAVQRHGNTSDKVLFAAMLALSGLGLLMIYSATRSLGTFPMERQMVFVAAGLTLYLVASNIDYREYRHLAPWFSGLILVLLVVVFAFEPINGAQRWIPLGFFNLQPAEFAKVAVILVMASLLSPANRDELGRKWLPWSKVGQALLVVAIPGALIFKEPDLGTALVFGFILFAMLFAAGATWRQMTTLTAGTAVAGLAMLRFELLEEYQLNRIKVLFDSTVEPQGIGYNLRQSKTAIGSGQLLGKGLFEGTQTNFQYVPEQETDFIFTAVGEQLGFVGGIIVVIAFTVIVWRLLVVSVNARDRYGALIAVGIAAMVAFHVFVNVGMTIGVTPVTGLPLPLLS